MFKAIVLCGIVVLISAVSGCASMKKDNKTSQITNAGFEFLAPEQAAALRKRTEAFTQSMVRSFKTGDFSYWKSFVQKEGEAGKPIIIDESKFQAMRQRLEKSWGKFVKCQYMGSLDQSLFRDYIWKCTFETEADSGKVVRLEELFVVRCTVLNGKTTFAGFGFRFFNRPGFRDQVIKIKKAEVKNEKTN